MSALTFDSNRWYEITIFQPEAANQSINGFPPNSTTSRGEVRLSPINETSPGQRWQFYPYNSSDFLIRSAHTPDAFLCVALRENYRNPAFANVPRLCNPSSVLDGSVFWQVEAWEDARYYLTNRANGTNWRLNHPAGSEEGRLFMGSNITIPQPSKQLHFEGGSNINDDRYNSIETFPTSLFESSPTSSPKSSSGLSTGAKAGIGVGVTIFALLLIALLAFFILRRRQRSKHHHEDVPIDELPAHDEPRKESHDPTSTQTDQSHDMYWKQAPVEAPAAFEPRTELGTGKGDGHAVPVAEMPANGGLPVELPATERIKS